MNRVIPVAVALLIAGACGGESTPVSPSPSQNPLISSSVAMLLMNCEVLGQDIACTALAMSGSPGSLATQEVTNEARWSVTPADVVAMVAPGRFRPLRAGEISIDVRSNSGDYRTLVPARFVVAPGTAARRLGTLMVIVRETAGPVNGAVVDVLDGYRAGTSCHTAVIGSCTIESIVTSETFTVRASKTGYQSGTATYRGTIDGLSPPAVLITLAPQ